MAKKTPYLGLPLEVDGYAEPKRSFVEAMGILDEAVNTSQVQMGGFITSKCKTDGTNESNRFTDEVLTSVESGKTLLVPSGKINLSSITTPIVLPSSVSLVSLSGRSVLSGWTGSAGRYSSLFDLQAGDFSFERIGFEFWGSPVYSKSTLGKLSFKRCLLQNNREHIKQDLSSTFTASSIDTLVIDDCDIIDSPGFAMEGLIGHANVENNRARRVRRNPLYYDYATASTYFLYAFCLGDHNNSPPAYGQDITNDVHFNDNSVCGVYNGSTAAAGAVLSSHGVNITATGVFAQGNYFRDFVSPPNDPFDTSGFYCKAALGEISHNIFSTSTRGRPAGVVEPNINGGSAMMTIKGTHALTAQPVASKLNIHHNTIQGGDAGPVGLGIWVFGSSNDVIVADNRVYDMPDGAVKVTNSPLRTDVLRNKAVRCGGIPFLWQCADVIQCRSNGNEIIDQVMPNAAYTSRLLNPYSTGSSFNAQGVRFSTTLGQVNGMTIVSGGSGYAVNGSPNGGCYVAMTAGVGGNGTEKAYAYFKDGVLVAIAGAGVAAGFTTAPVVSLPMTSVQDGLTLTNTGTQASVTTSLSLGALIDVQINDTSVSGTAQSDGTLATLSAYDCIGIYNQSSVSTKNVNIDGLTAVVDGPSSFSVVGANLYGPGAIVTGSACNIKMLGDTAGRRQQPWRASNSSNLAKFGAIGTQFKLGDAMVATGRLEPQSLLYVSEGKGRIIVAFDRFVSGNNFIGQLVGGAFAGAVCITSVSPRFVVQSGGTALVAASGTPSVSVGITSGGGEIVPATAIGSLATVSSPVTGARANEVVPTGSLDASLYVNITGGTITANSKAYLIVDFTYTLLV